MKSKERKDCFEVGTYFSECSSTQHPLAQNKPFSLHTSTQNQRNMSFPFHWKDSNRSLHAKPAPVHQCHLPTRPGRKEKKKKKRKRKRKRKRKTRPRISDTKWKGPETMPQQIARMESHKDMNSNRLFGSKHMGLGT